jgi:hypothetical protein
MTTVLFAVSCVCRGGEGCISQQQGVKVIVENNDRKILSTVRVRIANDDDDSLRLLSVEGEMKAKQQLVRHKANEKTETAHVSGVILRESCRQGNHLYVTVETSDSLRSSGRKLKLEMEKSLTRTPTPQSR